MSNGKAVGRHNFRSLRAQAALIFVLLALVPALVVGVLLVDVNRAAVETSERQLQAAVLAEVTTDIERVTDSARDELSAGASPIVADPAALRRELAATLQSRFGSSHVRVLVIDAERRAIVSNLDAAAEQQAISIDLWKLLPDPSTWSTHHALIGTHREGDVAMLGAVETIPSLGWAVALWRPRDEAYATLAAMKLRTAGVAAFSIVFGLGLALVTARRLTSPLRAMATKSQAIGARAWTALEPLPSTPNELGDLSRSLDRMADQLQKSEIEIERQARLRNELGRFSNPMLVERILRGEHSIALGGARATVSVLFADVVGFTPIAERAPPETVVGLLNELFALLTEVVMRNDGIVDKFVGDSVMAIFGAPEPTAEHARQALSAAEEMLHFVQISNEDWMRRYGVRIRLGIGISSGECTLGNLGSDKRMEYTAIGDVVNVAARLEALAAADQVLLTDSTRQAAGEGFEFVAIGEQSLAGRQAKVTVFALGGG